MSGSNGNGRANGNPMGRPRTILWDTDPGLRKSILDMLELGSSLSEAAAVAGVSADVLRRWKCDHSHIRGAIARARSDGRNYRLRCVKAGAEKDWRAAAWLLACDNPNRYSPKHRVEHSTPAKPMGEGLDDADTLDALDRLGNALETEGAESKPGGNSRLPH